jgi:hypothetical protein
MVWQVLGVIGVGVVASTAVGCLGRSQAVDANGPRFVLEANWPRPLPNRWQLGPVTGIFVDRHDQIWINSQSDKLDDYDLALARGAGDCCIASPRVVVFNTSGDVVKSWGGPGEGYDWPAGPHSIYLDHKENVWITANGKNDAHVLKFTNDGKFLLQIGKPGMSKGNGDTQNLNRSAGLAVWPDTNEVLVGDGYGNRRVIVFDADTGAYKRMWGAYGTKNPSDAEPERRFEGEGAAEFSTVHGLSITPDGVVWVADRVGNRIQQFRLDGTYIQEAFVARGTTNDTGTVYGFSFSPDLRWVYVADGSNKKVHILNRETLQEVGSFGGSGGQLNGSFNHLHGTAVDSRGDVYTGEAAAGARIQKWVRQR